MSATPGKPARFTPTKKADALPAATPEPTAPKPDVGENLEPEQSFDDYLASDDI